MFCVAPTLPARAQEGSKPQQRFTMEWAYDWRWVAVATWKQTDHMFAVHPYGENPGFLIIILLEVMDTDRFSFSSSYSSLCL